MNLIDDDVSRAQLNKGDIILPQIEQLATTWKVTFPDDREEEYGSLKSAIEDCLVYSDIIKFIPWQKVERAPYTGSIEHDPMYIRKV